MAFWKRNESEPAGLEVTEQLLGLVDAPPPEADPATVRIVTAFSGLLACVAFSDRELHDAERAHLREVLGRVHGMSAEGAEAICSLLEKHVTELTAINSHAYTRALRDLTDREMRLEFLDVLVDVGAADGELSFQETQLLRRLTSALGLEQQDYNLTQERHRDRLSSHKR
jgi:uncharacterized tellurite resistance protein B-like protein